MTKRTAHLACAVLDRGLLIVLSSAAVLLSAVQVFAAAPADTTEVTLRAVAGLQYDRTRFRVEPGAPVRLTLENTDDMMHNLLITEPGARMEVVEAARAVGPDRDHVPGIAEVLFFTPVLEPGQSHVLSFTAPREAGVYPYVCTFPGHGIVMYGAMYVGTEMPPLADDSHIPAERRGEAAEAGSGARASGHPYPVELPALYRTFMPESSPASIAVGLPGGLSYCFDASFSFLRYAWHGGFVDQTEQWEGNGVAFSKILGEIYYRNPVGFPFRLGASDRVPDVEFEGYRLVEGGYPEFRYRAGGVEVRELIKGAEEGIGLERIFEVRGAERPIWFVTGRETGVTYEASAGTWEGRRLKLTPEQAARFSITMTQATN